MNYKKNILICLLLVQTISLLQAQYIDTCTVGSIRTYTAVGGFQHSKYTWAINYEELQNQTTENIVYTWTESGVFTISVTETTQTGCKGKIYTYLILVSDSIDDYEILIPNIFTPNGDGTNDLFTVKCRNIESYEIEIYNRWGTKLYQSVDISTAWDGTHKGIKCTSGVYYYSIVYKKNNEIKKINRFLHLIE